MDRKSRGRTLAAPLFKALVLTSTLSSAYVSAGVAQEPGYVHQGALECHILSGAEFSSESRTRAICQFRSKRGDPSETYFARLHTDREPGPGIGDMRWDVFAPERSAQPLRLANQYVGGAPAHGLSGRAQEQNLVGGRDPLLVLRPAPRTADSKAPFASSVDELVLTATQ